MSSLSRRSIPLDCCLLYPSVGVTAVSISGFFLFPIFRFFSFGVSKFTFDVSPSRPSSDPPCPVFFCLSTSLRVRTSVPVRPVCCPCPPLPSCPSSEPPLPGVCSPVVCSPARLPDLVASPGRCSVAVRLRTSPPVRTYAPVCPDRVPCSPCPSSTFSEPWLLGVSSPASLSSNRLSVFAALSPPSPVIPPLVAVPVSLATADTSACCTSLPLPSCPSPTFLHCSHISISPICSSPPLPVHRTSRASGCLNPSSPLHSMFVTSPCTVPVSYVSISTLSPMSTS